MFGSSSISQLFRSSKIALLLVAFLANGIFETAVSAPYAMPQEPQTLTKPLQYEVTVTLKLIQVYVTDKAGNPVRDLTKDEFAILDNGRAMTVTEFERHELPAPGADTPAKEVAPAAPAPPAPATINRKFILFFDFAFNNLKGAGASLKAALHFLDTDVRPADEVAVLSYSMLKGLRVHEFLTPDRAKARQAVVALSTNEIAGRADEVESEYWTFFAEASEYAAQKSAARVESKFQARNYIDRLTVLARAMRLVPGQKIFLFFSTGVPYTLVHGNRGPGDTVLQPLCEAMLKEFSASNCSFYAFDTRESAQVTSLFGFDELQFAGSIGGYFDAEAVGSTATNPFRDDKYTGMDTLKKLSKQTGGQYYSNLAFYKKNMDQVQGMTGTYYVLGYSIAAANDGKFHDVKVEVKRKGCQVRAQRGYFDPKPFKEFTALEKELQLFDLALNERSEFGAPKTFPMTALAYDAGEGLRLRALARIPKEVVEFFGGKVAELVALFFDERENLLSLQRTTADLNTYKGADLLFTSGIAAPAGPVKCRLVIRDLETGQSAVASAKAFLVKPDPARIAVATPLLLVPEVTIKNLDGTAKGKLDVLTWHDIYPFDSNRYAPIIGDEPIRAGKIIVVVPFIIPGSGEHDVTFSAYLIHSATGQNLPVPVQPMNRFVQGHIHAQLLEMALDQVPSGKYMVYVNASDRTAGALASGHVPLTLSR